MQSDEIIMPIITTDRLVLRALSFDDAPAIQLLRSDERVNQLNEVIIAFGNNIFKKNRKQLCA